MDAIATTADAERSLAIRAASGVDGAHDLRAGLRHLQQAAELGSRAAQAELAALVGNWNLARDVQGGKPLRAGMAERLCAAIDVAAWQRLPDGEMFSEAPRIAVARKFVPVEACDWLVRLATPHLQAAVIFDESSGALRPDPGRTNRSAELTLAQSDMVLAFVRSRIAALADVPIKGLEPSQVMHYEVGQVFRAHHDFFDVGIPAYQREVAARGQRALTVLVYLNDRYQGGETDFPELGKSFKGRKGDALIFWNVRDDGAPDRRTLHAGSAPTSGEKWLLSQWIRVRPA